MRQLGRKADIAQAGVGRPDRVRRWRGGGTALSWALWLLAVLAFTLWTQATYRTPVAPAWLGLTIRVGVFAAWALLVREWVAIRL